VVCLELIGAQDFMTWKGFGKRGRRIVEVTFRYLREETNKDNEKSNSG